MQDVSGYYFIDGIDLFANFGLIIEEGSADCLRYPPRKESITHDWMDQNGIDVDTSRVFFGPREIVLNMAIFATSEADYWTKRDQFISQMAQPGERRLNLKSHGERSYYVIYKECNNYKAAKALKGSATNDQVVYRFSMVLTEPNPQLDASHVFLVTEDDVFIIT